jgi:hypothetical protein
MRSRRRLILASIVGLLLFGYFLLWLTSPGPGMNRRGFDLIQPGMSEAEVIAILGAEPGDYITGKVEVEWRLSLSEFSLRMPIADFRANASNEEASGVTGLTEWYSDEGIIRIRFDADGLVQDKAFRRVFPETEPFLVKLRRWFLIPA